MHHYMESDNKHFVTIQSFDNEIKNRLLKVDFLSAYNYYLIPMEKPMM